MDSTAYLEAYSQSGKQLFGLCPGDVARIGCQADCSLRSSANFEPSQLTHCPLIDLQLLVANGELIAPHRAMLSFTFLLT